DGEVCQLANLDRTSQCFFKGSVCRPDSEHLEGLFTRYSLFRMPTFAGKALHVFARDCRVKLDHRLATFDRRVGSTGNNRARFKKRSPGICTCKSVDPKTTRREV